MLHFTEKMVRFFSFLHHYSLDLLIIIPHEGQFPLLLHFLIKEIAHFIINYSVSFFFFLFLYRSYWIPLNLVVWFFTNFISKNILIGNIPKKLEKSARQRRTLTGPTWFDHEVSQASFLLVCSFTLFFFANIFEKVLQVHICNNFSNDSNNKDVPSRPSLHCLRPAHISFTLLNKFRESSARSSLACNTVSKKYLTFHCDLLCCAIFQWTFNC